MSRNLSGNEQKLELDLVWQVCFLFLLLLGATFSALEDPQPESLRTDVAVAQRDAQEPPPPLRIRVARGGTVTVEGWDVGSLDLEALRTRLRGLDSLIVIVSPDPDVAYRHAAPLLRLIRDTGHAVALDTSPSTEN